jgi:hypothetical protein
MLPHGFVKGGQIVGKKFEEKWKQFRLGGYAG